MSDFQIISFILLWIVILTEGTLLFLLYRHVALLFAAPPREEAAGLPAGAQAPSFEARNAYGAPIALDAMLTAERNLLIFGTFSCEPCRTLLRDSRLRHVLATTSIQAYFVHSHTNDAPEFADLFHLSSDELQIVTVDEQVFTSYHIPTTPYGYILDRTGTIKVSTPLTHAQHLIEICAQTLEAPAGPAGQEQLILIESQSKG